MGLTAYEEKILLDLLEDENRDAAKKSHLKFIDYTWKKNKKSDPFIHGFHTKKICSRIDMAIEDFRNGKSTCLLINVHPRSGKTDIVSRYLGAHFLGEFPGKEVMQVSYSAGKAESFAAFGRDIFKSAKYRELYPEIGLSKETNKKSEWLIADSNQLNTGGSLYASGLQSGLTGSGFHLGILDDYCAGRAEAESEVQRTNAWEAFRDDFMTRRAPVFIVIILATQWHWDDISGRIRKEMKENPNFPRFDELVFSARAVDYTGPGEYPGEYLFLERFSRQYYLEQYATLGKYSAAALMDCNPTPREGGFLKTENIIYYTPEEINKVFPSLTEIQWYRVWDLAHKAKERGGDDPDWTSGTLLGFKLFPGDPLPHLYVRDIKRIREGAGFRDSVIKTVARGDGTFIKQAMETSIDAMDAYDYISKSVKEISWIKIKVKGDKLVRATPLEPIFEAVGHVHVAKAKWNDDWVDELVKFDGLENTHDDQVDNLSAGYQHIMGGLRLSAEHKKSMRARRQRAQ